MFGDVVVSFDFFKGIGGEVTSVVQTEDGGYLVTGVMDDDGKRSYAIKLTSDFKIEWSASFKSKIKAAKKALRGGYILGIASDQGFEVIKIDTKGKISWGQRIKVAAVPALVYDVYEVTRTDESGETACAGYVLYGGVQSQQTDWDLYLAGISCDGSEILWQYTFGGNSWDSARTRGGKTTVMASGITEVEDRLKDQPSQVDLVVLAGTGSYESRDGVMMLPFTIEVTATGTISGTDDITSTVDISGTHTIVPHFGEMQLFFGPAHAAIAFGKVIVKRDWMGNLIIGWKVKGKGRSGRDVTLIKLDKRMKVLWEAMYASVRDTDQELEDIKFTDDDIELGCSDLSQDSGIFLRIGRSGEVHATGFVRQAITFVKLVRQTVSIKVKANFTIDAAYQPVVEAANVPPVTDVTEKVDIVPQPSSDDNQDNGRDDDDENGGRVINLDALLSYALNKQFATQCVMQSGWYGEYQSTISFSEVMNRPMPGTRNGKVPAPVLLSDPFLGLLGSGFPMDEETEQARFPGDGRVFFTCNDSVNFNFGTGASPIDFFNAEFGQNNPPVHDMNNTDLQTGEPLLFLGSDYWAAHWLTLYEFDPDPTGANGCLTTKVSGPNGGGVMTRCIPGLYLVQIEVNDGGRIFIGGGVPRDLLNWYDAFQDRKSSVKITFVFNAFGHAVRKGYSLRKADGTSRTFKEVLEMYFYEKDGRAVARIDVKPFVDRKSRTASISAVESNDAAVMSDTVPVMIDSDPHDVWANLVLPDTLFPTEPVTVAPPATETAPELVPLSSDQIVTTLYLPMLTR